jgi:multimeric flavodoxin WrbA
MKIVLISASPRGENSQTLLLAREVLEGCSAASPETEIIDLGQCDLEFCLHREECHRQLMACPANDDGGMILQKMLDADGIVMASPNYINHVTGAMKTLMDRSNHFIHCKRLLGKYVTGVVSSGSGNDRNVLDYIRYYAHTCGAQYSGGVSSAVPIREGKKEEARNLGRKFVADIEDKKQYGDQLEIIEEGRRHFAKVIERRRDEWQAEYDYWREKGWL